MWKLSWHPTVTLFYHPNLCIARVCTILLTLQFTLGSLECISKVEVISMLILCWGVARVMETSRSSGIVVSSSESLERNCNEGTKYCEKFGKSAVHLLNHCNALIN